VVPMGCSCVVLSIARRRQHELSLYMHNHPSPPTAPIRRRDQNGGLGMDGAGLLSFCVSRDGDNLPRNACQAAHGYHGSNGLSKQHGSDLFFP
jgi:hypothetical protein